MKTLLGLVLVLSCSSAMADDWSSFGRDVSQALTKSGSFATCSLEGREVEDAVKAVSAAYSGKFSTTMSIRPYGGDTSSMKACLTINAK